MRESVWVRRLLIRFFALSAICIFGFASACSSEKTTDGASDASSDVTPNEASVADADGGASDGDAATTCTVVGNFGSKECNACVSTRCCEELAACTGEAQCPELQKCVLDCALDSDAGGCRNGCLATYPSARPKWEAVEQCVFRDPPPTGCIADCTF